MKIIFKEKKGFTLVEIIFVIVIIAVLLNFVSFNIIDYSLIGIREFINNFYTMVNLNKFYSCYNLNPVSEKEKRYYNCFNHLKIFSKNNKIYYVIFNDYPNNKNNYDNKVNMRNEILFKNDKYFSAYDFNGILDKNKLNNSFDLSSYNISKVIIKDNKNKILKKITLSNNEEFDILINSNFKVFLQESNNDGFNYYKNKNYLKNFIIIKFYSNSNPLKVYKLKLSSYGFLKFN